MRKQKLLTKALAASMAVFMSVSQLSVPAFAAEGTKSVSIAGSTYTYSAEALEGYTQIGNSGLYYKLTNGTGFSGTIYGTSNLTYKEFYSGDVSSTDSFDVVTTASTSKYSVLSNVWTDYEEESAEAAGGYSGTITKSVPLDLNAIPSDAEGGTYSVTISCDDYADIYVAIPVTEEQKAQLQELIKQAETALKGADDSVLLAHKNEAAELLANESSTSADAADLINELTELLKPYQSTEAPTPSIPDSTTASKPNTTTAAKPATKPATTAKKTNTTAAAKVKLTKQTAKVKANGKKKIKVSWKKDKNASGYEITYSTNKSFKGKKTIVVKSNKTTSKVVKKLTSKKKYFVKVRSYKQVGKTKTYGAYSKVKTVKVK